MIRPGHLVDRLIEAARREEPLGTLFDRTTSEYHSLSDLPGEVLAALRADVEKFELPGVEANVIACYQTTSVPTKKHKKDKESEIQHLSIVLTPEMLYWVLDWRGKINVNWARLSEIEVGDYRRSPEYEIMPDTGVDVRGFVRGGPERVSAFIGLGEGGEADKLMAALGEAVKKAGGVWKQ